jgi:hypothetical protein
MKEDAAGLPMVGPSGRMLGVRPGNALAPDVSAIDPLDSVAPGQGGMSVAPDNPMHLISHRRPASLGGSGVDPVWYIEIDDLGTDLQFRQDKTSHGLIEPSHFMTLRDLQDALAKTQPRWQLFCR